MELGMFAESLLSLMTAFAVVRFMLRERRLLFLVFLARGVSVFLILDVAIFSATLILGAKYDMDWASVTRYICLLSAVAIGIRGAGVTVPNQSGQEQ